MWPQVLHPAVRPFLSCSVMAFAPRKSEGGGAGERGKDTRRHLLRQSGAIQPACSVRVDHTGELSTDSCTSTQRLAHIRSELKGHWRRLERGREGQDFVSSAAGSQEDVDQINGWGGGRLGPTRDSWAGSGELPKCLTQKPEAVFLAG